MLFRMYKHLDRSFSPFVTIHRRTDGQTAFSWLNHPAFNADRQQDAQLSQRDRAAGW